MNKFLVEFLRINFFIILAIGNPIAISYTSTQQFYWGVLVDTLILL